MAKRKEAYRTSTEYVIGIDPSISGTSAAIIDRNGRANVCRFPSSPDRNVHRLVRCRLTIHDVIEWIKFSTASGNVIWIEIEQYAFAAAWRAHQLGEFGGLLRAAICDAFGTYPAETNPSAVKMFATGNGRADKDHMMRSVADQWGMKFHTDDEADAYVLARIACCRIGWESPRGAHQLQALAPVKPKQFKRRGKASSKAKSVDVQTSLLD